MKDNIFNISNNKIEPFTFDKKVSEVFDDMLIRSIPYYQQIVEATGKILTTIPYPDGQLYDLGSSTGTLLCYLSKLLPDLAHRMIGVDNSGPMIEKAKQKARQLKTAQNVKFIEADISNLRCESAAVIILNFTLQFISPEKRSPLLKKLYADLIPGGILIISEKVAFPQGTLGEKFVDIYYQYKKAHGYSDLEISNKRDALEHILIPETIDVHLQRLRDTGFTQLATFFQWFNFASFLGIKNVE